MTELKFGTSGWRGIMAVNLRSPMPVWSAKALPNILKTKN